MRDSSANNAESGGKGGGLELGLGLGVVVVAKFNSNQTTRIVNSTQLDAYYLKPISLCLSLFMSVCFSFTPTLSSLFPPETFAFRFARCLNLFLWHHVRSWYVWQKWSFLAFGFTFRPDKLKLEHCPASHYVYAQYAHFSIYFLLMFAMHGGAPLLYFCRLSLVWQTKTDESL